MSTIKDIFKKAGQPQQQANHDRSEYQLKITGRKVIQAHLDGAKLQLKASLSGGNARVLLIAARILAEQAVTGLWREERLQTIKDILDMFQQVETVYSQPEMRQEFRQESTAVISSSGEGRKWLDFLEHAEKVHHFIGMMDGEKLNGVYYHTLAIHKLGQKNGPIRYSAKDQQHLMENWRDHLMECKEGMHAEQEARKHHSTTLSDHHKGRVASAIVKVLVEPGDVPIYNAKRYVSAQAIDQQLATMIQARNRARALGVTQVTTEFQPFVAAVPSAAY